MNLAGPPPARQPVEVERLRRLATFWNWLPAFRAVAESQHLPTAALALGISAPALSRAIHLLEAHLGRPLFDRIGRRVVLNARGAAFLDHLRDAMRLVDDAYEAVRTPELAGPLAVSAPSAFVPIFVLPAIERLRERNPELVPTIWSDRSHLANQRLLNGTLDVALLDDPEVDARLVVERVARLGYGVYCGPGHALYGHPGPSLDDLAGYGFAGPPGGEDDHWPPDRTRQVALRLAYLHLGVEACAGGRYLAVLPDAIARAWTGPEPLWRLVSLRAETALYAVHRPRPAPRVVELLAAIREEIARRAPASLRTP